MSRTNHPYFFLSAICLLFYCAAPSQAQLRIVDYNTAGVSNSAAMTTVLSAINAESVNGIAKPIDVLILQELSSGDITTVRNILNGLNVGTYVAGNVGTTTGSGGVGLIYRSESVDLLEQLQVVNTSTSGAARGVMRYKLAPDGYSSPDAEFYVYGSHYKASDTTSDANRRNVEAVAIRANADALAATRQLSGQITNIIHTGDFNIYRSSEPMWATLTGAGLGQLFDPMDNPALIGTWHDGLAFKGVHTQNPAGTGFVGGGMDDRFDWQMINAPLKNGEGLAYIGPVSGVPEMSGFSPSYRAFGNNNTHTINAHINTGTGASPAVLSALGAASDHLPVVADYQLPAILDATAPSIPFSFTLNQSYSFDVEVKNAANALNNVLTSLGADELDYSLSVSGDLISPLVVDTDSAYGLSNLHSILLDTSSPGLKSGIITVMSNSQAVENGFLEIPINFEVLGVPEPTSLVLLLLGLGFLPFRRRG